jgi:hypothetical protein
MSTNKSRQERIQDIIARTNLSTKSVNWWENETDNIINKINFWENSNDLRAEEEINKLRDRLESLLPRAQVEIQVIDNLEKELNNLLKEINDEKKLKAKKKSNRKKNI